MSYIARQPNGLLCRFSTIVDAVTHINMSEEDYIEMCAERAREEAKRDLEDERFVKSFDCVLEDTLFDNMTYDEWQGYLKEMGYVALFQAWRQGEVGKPIGRRHEWA